MSSEAKPEMMDDGTAWHRYGNAIEREREKGSSISQGKAAVCQIAYDAE